MELLSWINSQENPSETKKLLERVLGRSESTVVSYIYGYRKVPDSLVDKIQSFTNGEVKKADLEKPFHSFHKANNFVFAPAKGQRVDKPLLTISMNPTIEDFNSFISGVMEVLEVGV